MKKINAVMGISLLAFTIISCSKTSVSKSSEQIASPTPSPKAEVNIVSDWVVPDSFSEGADRLGNSFIKGTYSFTAAVKLSYDKNAHMELVYVRIPTNQRVPYQYTKLPFAITIDINGARDNVSIDHSIDPDGLQIYFKNAEYAFVSKTVDLSVSQNWNYRYIVIPKSKYQSLTVDWNDLPAVAAALNFSL